MIELKSRERKIVIACVGLIVLALVYAILVSPTLEKRDDLERKLTRAEKQLSELRALAREYEQILSETGKIKSRMGSRGRGFDLFSFLEQTAIRLNLRDNLEKMNPSKRSMGGNLTEELVDIELEGISLQNLVAYTSQIEKANAAIAIPKIRILPESKHGGGLKVTMLVTSISSR